jgi:GPH family glycoside/pentoside/hexuronide:cation symporter
LVFFTGFNILRVSINYFVTDIMGRGAASITLASALLFGVSALCFVPVKIAASKFGYRKLMLISLFMLAFLSLCLFALDKIIPAKFGFLILALCGIPVSGAAFIFPPAMLSEIAADISGATGKQIEGLLFGVRGFFLKLAFLISIAILPLILVSGAGHSFIEVLTTIPEKPEKIGIYNTALYAFLFFMIAAFFYYKYPENRNTDVAIERGAAGGSDGKR